jgi:ribonuclease BN (tRNA processing enzyme)
MKLLLLGTGGYHPCERRQTACFMLPEAGIVLDAGTGFFRVREHVWTSTLDIFLTHAHLDHVVGLTYLLSTTWQRPLKRVTVHGTEHKLAAVREHLLNDDLFPAPLGCEWRPLADGTTSVGDAHVTHFPVEHPGGAVGYRLDWPDRSLAYVTDTTASPAAAYVDKVRGVDLLLHECNFRDEQIEWAHKTGHSYASAVGRLAAAAEVKRLVLVHFDSLADRDDPIDLVSVRRHFERAELGGDGMEVEF